ncbi:hypothetical protein SynBIOSE41_01975 [Synechococcus sp. BIOS-E4-1]|nr:hypothetical protein SynBIOSE41_01975 [Synechococcus sp. BIOS-E4-1]
MIAISISSDVESLSFDAMSTYASESKLRSTCAEPRLKVALIYRKNRTH